MTTNKRPTYPIGSVDSALKLLLLVGEREQIRIGEAAEELGVARSTAHRLMQMLSYHGFVRQDPASRAYRAGTVLFEMGLQVVQNLDIRSHSRPAIEALSRDLNETVQLFVPVHDSQMACIDAVEGTRPVRVGGRVGSVIPAQRSAAGYAMLAETWGDRAEPLQANVAEHELESQLVAARALGYAVDRGGLELEVSSVAAAVRDHRGRPSFAVAVTVPSSRMGEEDVPRLGAAAIRCATEIAEALPW